MTTSERRGLIALTIVLSIILVFVITRSAIFDSSAGDDSINISESSMGTVHTSKNPIEGVSKDSMTVGDSLSRSDLSFMPDTPNKRFRQDMRRKMRRQKSKREPIVRDPLSQPVN